MCVFFFSFFGNQSALMGHVSDSLPLSMANEVFFFYLFHARDTNVNYKL